MILSDVENTVLQEELALLVRVQDAILVTRGDARAGREAEARSLASVGDLRAQAGETAMEDWPTLLQDMTVRQQVLNRRGRYDLPDPGSPYLAHMRVREGDVEKDYLLGNITFIDTRVGVRVVDWRVAPIAQVFYSYREGDAFDHEVPGRTIEGVVLARRILTIENGDLRRVMSGDIALERDAAGAWRSLKRAAMSLSSGGANTAARPGILGVGAGSRDRPAAAEITALLDQEQYEAISAPPEDALLVLGSAGSGKTTVALHRLARIHAAAPHKYPLEQIKVVVPEEGLARLSRRLLQPLGAGAAQVATLDAWAQELAARVFERDLKLHHDAPGLVVSLKRHHALYVAMRERFSRLDGARTLETKRLRRVLAEMFTNRDFLTKVVALSEGELSGRCIDAVITQTMRQIGDHPDKELRSIMDEERRTALDGRPLSEGAPEAIAGTIDIEDLPIMLFLRAWRADLGGRNYSMAVLDEAEDFSLFELFVVGRMLGKRGSITLAGDEAQQTASSFAGWGPSLETLGSRKTATCKLTTSYRCPKPIADLARSVLGPLAPETPVAAARDGVPVGMFPFTSPEQAQLHVIDAVVDLAEREPQASIAVIAADPEAAKRLYALMHEGGAARLVTDGAFSFDPGIDVTDVDNVKGLEFDYVIIPDASGGAYPMNNDARRRLHVAVTRASHQLWVVSGGGRSPLLPVD
ncbi:MAG: ATP-binding domain-containing protein [Clostridia bacterium]|nr:ATP-binding domain-containing protein [Deltaproteobacteria bacterium]